MDIGRLKNNKQYCAWWPERDILLWLKENPEFNLCICYDYFAEIFGKPIFNGEPWVGFTRDYQEDKGGWETASEIDGICSVIKVESIHNYGKKLQKYLILSLIF